MADSFWTDSNAYWRSALQRLSTGQATPADWEEVNWRVWCLTKYVPEAEDARIQDREDLVQSLLLKLMDVEMVKRLCEVDAPAHYLAEVMRNHMHDLHKQEGTKKRSFRRYAKRRPPTDAQSPAQLAEWNELCAKARFIVNHVVSADDRKVLGWYYWDGLSAKEIGEKLHCSEEVVWQRLTRARKRVKAQYPD